MKKDLERTEAKKLEIISAALELFFEKGYEGTSIRMIQKAIGKEVGLFYYYFDSKDVVFEAAIDLFFDSYEEEMRKIIDAGKENPDKELTKYIQYINEATQSFREQYIGKLHWSILGAIREHTMRIMKKYIRQILDNYVEKEIIKSMPVDIEVAVNMLAFGVGGSILYQNGDKYDSQKKDVEKMILLLTSGAERI